MISFPISDEMPVCIIGSPEYFSQYGYPNSVSELSHHRCINLRLPTSGGIYAWELRENNCDMKIKVSGQCVFNTIQNVKQACLDGLGLAYIPKLHVQHQLDTGELEQIMSEFTPPFPAFHIYYPSRRQQSMAFGILLQALKKSNAVTGNKFSHQLSTPSLLTVLISYIIGADNTSESACNITGIWP
ncbi:LysR substrate-binding domain-containing protein (plasmid) [Enterobacter kobei]|uniref:LysR substrate-binding domain-containing protein n=1 Tax=Enterobacter kobei TaxID=208224 RepID=UPI00224B3982|nr:LysR substrate-binding domain-containing protein [Enterobacter kobei]UZQ70545.1 LysR substrate-binding domain-containing protein [Enterobacter kobei]